MFIYLNKDMNLNDDSQLQNHQWELIKENVRWKKKPKATTIWDNKEIEKKNLGKIHHKIKIINKDRAVFPATLMIANRRHFLLCLSELLSLFYE